jgi:hypothetical protein
MSHYHAKLSGWITLAHVIQQRCGKPHVRPAKKHVNLHSKRASSDQAVEDQHYYHAIVDAPEGCPRNLSSARPMPNPLDHIIHTHDHAMVERRCGWKQWTTQATLGGWPTPASILWL